MLGSECEPGVIYFTMMDLYKQIEERKNDKTFDVAISYSEVHEIGSLKKNENIVKFQVFHLLNLIWDVQCKFFLQAYALKRGWFHLIDIFVSKILN